MSRLLIVDDHAIVRDGLRRLLESMSSICHIEECSSGEEAYQYLQNNSTDIVIMDISMPGKGGLESTSLIKKRYPKIKVLILSMHDSSLMIQKAKNAGANGYIFKNEISDNLLKGIQKVLEGKDAFPSVQAQEKVNTLELLNGKEFEIFRFIANGKNIHFIADKMNMSYKTIANYQTAIKKKLNIENVLEFYTIAKEHSVII